jgi:hypothetical protein
MYDIDNVKRLIFKESSDSDIESLAHEAHELTVRRFGKTMELGADAVLVNTAIATAQNPKEMAAAFRQGVEAGRRAFIAGCPPEREKADASSPLTGFLFNAEIAEHAEKD